MGHAEIRGMARPACGQTPPGQARDPRLEKVGISTVHDDGGNDFKINGKLMGNYLGYSMTWPFNNMKWCPVMSVPSGFGNGHMPTGIQICGRTFDDHSVFRIASAIERARPWIGERPKI